MKVLALVCLVAACGNSDPKKPDAHLIDAEAIDAPPDVAIDAAPLVHFGRVEVSQGTSNGSADSNLSVTFSTDQFGPAIGTDGPCTVIGVASEATFSAGNIAVTGTASALSSTPTGSAPSVHYATSGTVPKPAFTAGDTITFTGQGGADVGAFTASVTAPAAITGYTVPTSISRSGYTATWTAGAGPTMWLIAAGFDNLGHGAYTICVVNDTGSFTIPATTFAMFPSTADMAYVGLGRVSPMTKNVGGVMVTVQATSYETSGSIAMTP